MALMNGFVWIDAQGQRVLHVITVASAVGSIEVALEAASNAVVVQQWGGTQQNNAVTPAVATYPTVRVTVALYYEDAIGSRATLYLPAPVGSIFLTDGVTVDPTNALIIAINSAAIGQLLAGSGNPVTSFVGGQLIQTKFSGLETT